MGGNWRRIILTWLLPFTFYLLVVVVLVFWVPRYLDSLGREREETKKLSRPSTLSFFPGNKNKLETEEIGLSAEISFLRGWGTGRERLITRTYLSGVCQLPCWRLRTSNLCTFRSSSFVRPRTPDRTRRDRCYVNGHSTLNSMEGMQKNCFIFKNAALFVTVHLNGQLYSSIIFNRKVVNHKFQNI